jgi:pimeloyl-ACP methyl ester carboxylesterase
MSGETEIHPFRVDMPDQAIACLQRRIAATRWPTRELVADRSQGVQLATIQELARYWTTDYDWRACEAELNALPQFKTEIDGEDIYFIHIRSRHENALPLIITHGWPGSVLEMLGVVGPLTDPTAHGGSADDAFDLVVPSIPGYGFSGEPAEAGWNVGRVAGAWAELMHRLGYDRYVAQGGDVGAAVTDAMGRQAPQGLAGIHMNLLLAGLGGGYPSAEPSAEERAALDAIATFRSSGNGYLIEQNTRPQTIGYALAARSYWENTQAAARAAGQARPEVKLPVGFTTFPGEIFRAPRSWAEKSYPSLSYFNEVDKGGHFAAWEEPELFATEIRAAFKPLR